MIHFFCIAKKINIGPHVENRVIPKIFAKELINLIITICKFCGIN